MHKLIFRVPLKGNPTLKVEGIGGPGCKKLTADLERALGKVVKDEDTNELYEKPLNEQVKQY